MVELLNGSVDVVMEEKTNIEFRSMERKSIIKPFPFGIRHSLFDIRLYKRRISMIKNMDKIIIFTGAIFILYGFSLYFFFSPPLQVGFMINIILYAMDSIWFEFSGALLIYCGIKARQNKNQHISLVSFAGHLIIFSLISLFTSYLFNVLATPHLQSTGRIFTFLLQSISRLITPSLSYEFMVPLCGLIVFAVSSILFQKVVMKKMVSNKEFKKEDLE